MYGLLDIVGFNYAAGDITVSGIFYVEDWESGWSDPLVSSPY